MNSSTYQDPQRYYDAYSEHYDQARRGFYHKTIDGITRDFLLQHVPSHGKVLDLGCGTGRNMQWLKTSACSVVGMDLSHAMLSYAASKGNQVIMGNAINLPFKDQTFDLVYSFKVLPHVVEIGRAIAEITRVLKPKGIALLEFYNPWSLRGFIKQGLRPKLQTSRGVTELEIYTRFDSYFSIRKLLQPSYTLLGTCGTVTFFPIAMVYEWQTIRPLITWVEKAASTAPLRFFSGFLMTAWKRNS